jgi:putative glycerol-1-phosphate prenyltransferase
MSILQSLIQQKKINQKGLAILIDPDQHGEKTNQIFELYKKLNIQLFLVGGSLLSAGITEKCVSDLKKLGAKNVVLFPGNEIQLCKDADALLFMSLISGRNPEFLIGKQVVAAPWIKNSKIEPIPTGYMLIDSGNITSALYMSGTLPIPNNKPDIAAATALAGQYLGMQVIYLDAGSGAQNCVNSEIIQAVNTNSNCVLFVGGGIKSAEQALNAWNNGADYIVVGNGVFENTQILKELSDVLNQINKQ